MNFEDCYRKYRIIERCSDGENFSRMRTANSAGLLAASQGICRQQTAEIHPSMPTSIVRYFLKSGYLFGQVNSDLAGCRRGDPK